MYKTKFRNRKEAFEYTMDKLPKAKKKDTILKNYSNAISTLPVGAPTLVNPTLKDTMIHQAFVFTEGSVPLNTIVVNEDGSLLI